MYGVLNIFADLVMALEEIIECHRHGDCMSPHDMHGKVREMYKWQNVAERTEKVRGNSL